MRLFAGKPVVQVILHGWERSVSSVPALSMMSAITFRACASTRFPVPANLAARSNSIAVASAFRLSAHFVERRTKWPSEVRTAACKYFEAGLL